MERIAVAVAVIVAAAVIALVVQRRRPDAPSTGHYDVPAQLDRREFLDPTAPWLAAVFTSASCESCAAVWATVSGLAGGNVAAQEVELGARPDLHSRYRIEAVPTTVIADDQGVVRASFLGPVDRDTVARSLDELDVS